ncbi:MAG: hypothetical protein J5814_01055 [Bacteroidaceae bacterium]|nr:hypothetical protein [Bacteroidaceae bacterium]
MKKEKRFFPSRAREILSSYFSEHEFLEFLEFFYGTSLRTEPTNEAGAKGFYYSGTNKAELRVWSSALGCVAGALVQLND